MTNSRTNILQITPIYYCCNFLLTCLATTGFIGGPATFGCRLVNEPIVGGPCADLGSMFGDEGFRTVKFFTGLRLTSSLAAARPPDVGGMVGVCCTVIRWNLGGKSRFAVKIRN